MVTLQTRGKSRTAEWNGLAVLLVGATVPQIGFDTSNPCSEYKKAAGSALKLNDKMLEVYYSVYIGPGEKERDKDEG